MQPSAPTFADAIAKVNVGTDLSAEETSSLIEIMLSGAAREEEIATLLLALREKGEAISELVGAARAMRSHMTVIPHHHDVLLDTCGTGGSGSGTFNISTTIAIVASACGVAVAKHGNRKASSLTGSADVLEELGVEIESDANAVAQRLDETGICFCFAAKLHPAMKHVVAVRRKLGVKTLFNMLGPLCNPAGATHQLLGTATQDAQSKVAQALSLLGTRRSFVVFAEDGQDEVSLDGVTTAIEVRDSVTATHRFTPSSFGLLPAGKEALASKNPQESAKILLQILAGEPGPCRDTVLAGTATALLLVDKVQDVAAGVEIAANAIDNGAAMTKLETMRHSFD